MKIAIKKNNLNLGIFKIKTNEQIVSEPFNYKIIEIDNKFSDCKYEDFNNNFEFDSVKYCLRKSKEKAVSEIELCKSKLEKYDYIGIKIATGRATIEDYAVQIAEMRELADKINELEKLL